MKRTLFLLLFYFCLTITVGKQVRMFCSQLLAGKSFSQSLTLDYSQSEAENEQTDSEDSETDDADNEDNELTALQILSTEGSSSFSNHPTSQLFKDHLQEIGTPPPRY